MSEKSSQFVFRVDITGLYRPPEMLWRASFNFCRLLFCSSISSTHILISCSGIEAWDEWECKETVSDLSTVLETSAHTVAGIGLSSQTVMTRKVAELDSSISSPITKASE